MQMELVVRTFAICPELQELNIDVEPNPHARLDTMTNLCSRIKRKKVNGLCIRVLGIDYMREYHRRRAATGDRGRRGRRGRERGGRLS